MWFTFSTCMHKHPLKVKIAYGGGEGVISMLTPGVIHVHILHPLGFIYLLEDLST